MIDIIAETLAWCNEMREAKGIEPLDELPKGVRGNGESCPCGKATGMSVGYRYAYPLKKVWPLDRPIPLPDAVKKFTLEFDRGDLPQFDKYS